MVSGARHSRYAGRIDFREKVLHSDPAWKAARKAAEDRRLELERQAAGEGGHYIPLLKGGTPKDEVRTVIRFTLYQQWGNNICLSVYHLNGVYRHKFYVLGVLRMLL